MQFDQRVDILRHDNAARNALGEVVGDWVTVGAMMGALEVSGATEPVAGGGRAGVQRAVVVMPRAAVTASIGGAHRLRIGAVDWDVEGVPDVQRGRVRVAVVRVEDRGGAL